MSKSTSIWSQRYTLAQFVRVSIMAEYKRSFLGFAHVLITPILGMIIWLLLRYAGILNVGETDIPYPLFLLIGNTLWESFNHTIITMSKTFTVYGKTISQIRIPVETLYLERFIYANVGYLISFILIIAVLLFYGVSIHPWAIALPILLIPFYALAMLIGILFSVFQIVTTDLSTYLQYFLRILFFITPVIYAEDAVSEWMNTIIHYNPISYFIVSLRNLLLEGTLYCPQITITLSVVVVALFVFVLLRVRKIFPTLIEKLYI